MKHNITKLMLTLVFALLTLPMQSQDFMNIFFKDGSFRKFYLKNVTEITTSKVDAKGTLHSDYKYQHIKTKSDKYVYNLDDVDSITFTKINEALAEQNFVSAMPKVLSAIDGCETIDDVESKVNEIKSAEGVADAWSDGHQLYVTIAEDETYSIHFNHGAPNSEALAAQVRDINTRASKIVKKDGTPLKAVIANQIHKDESYEYKFFVEVFLTPLIACLQECGIQTDYLDEPNVDFFYNNSKDPEHPHFYDYDLVFLMTHGNYGPMLYYRPKEDSNGNEIPRAASGLKGHSIHTSEDIKELDNNYWDLNYKAFKEWRDKTSYHDLTDEHLNYTIKKEIRNGKEVYIAHPVLTEYFFRDIAQGTFKNPHSIFFNGACQSLMGDEQPSYSFANILFNYRKLGIYAGYTKTDYFGPESASYFFYNMLRGGSVERSFDDLPNYCTFESLSNVQKNTKGYSDSQHCRFTISDLEYYKKEDIKNAELKIIDKSGSMPSDFFLFPTTTVEVDNNDLNKEYSDKKTITIEGYSTHLDDYKNPWENYGFEPSEVEIGFELGESSNLGPSFAVHSSIKKKEVNSEHGKYHFQCTIPDLEPGKTYHYRAYAYDGENYNYGRSYSFKIENSSSEEPNIETFTVNGVSFKMVKVEGGSFMMGSPDDDPDAGGIYSDETPQHKVSLDSYFIGETEVTQKLWKTVMGSNPSIFQGDNLPVEEISWDDSQVFIKKLNALTGKNFRLPTEAEWEYAARGGQKSNGYKYAGSNDVDKVAWNRNNSNNITHAVGTKEPNELGLYDMSGNVWEWCQDWYGFSYYKESPVNNPCNTVESKYKIHRGGSIEYVIKDLRVAMRGDYYNPPSNRLRGLRIVLANNSEGSTVSYLSCPDDNHPHAIDLGLPSGTLWACCNVGASKPEDCGGYYAWGEVETKNHYDWDNYVHCDGTKETLHNIGTDIAGTEYDVAHVKWGNGWVIPNNKQIEELLEYCSWDWTTLNGVNGMKIISPNGSSIFLPAGGDYERSGIWEIGDHGSYWSSKFDVVDVDCAYELGIWGDEFIFYKIFGKNVVYGSSSRFFGNTVRPVYKKK